MIGTINCVYETPCGWCSKFDKQCDCRAQKEEENNDECGHIWETCGANSAGIMYRCKCCGKTKTEPYSGVNKMVEITY